MNLIVRALAACFFISALCDMSALAAERKTTVSIVGDSFQINGQPTYAGREWRGHKVEGLLMNSRMVQGIFDDRNPATAARWAYPDTGKWDAERNTREFIAAMPEWRKHGLLAFTINFQGGSPEGYSKSQPWENNAFEPDGTLRADYTARLARILDRADELGMVAIVGYFYFGQDERLRDEAAVLRATDEATRWLLAGGWRNVLVEVNNECDVATYDHAVLKPDRVHELIERVRQTKHDGRSLPAGTSYKGGAIPRENVVRVSDFLLLHGNGVKEPPRIAEMVRQTRAIPSYRTMPILFNEDDHFDFEKPENNFTTAVGERASWGYFDFRKKGEPFDDGYQSVPVNWGLSSERKRGFFKLLAEITGAASARQTRAISGWQVHIQAKLLESEPADTERALAGLQKMLDEIVRNVPAPAVAELRKVPLYFSPAYKPGRSGAEFHPRAQWLRENGRDPAMARGVEFSGVHDFEAEMRRMPNFALHELAHAYHHRVLKDGFDNAEIKAAYERVKAAGKYERVERTRGDGKPNTFERAYAMTDPMEYFAETTEAFFSRNDFFPFTRDELKQHDPKTFALLAKLWGVTETK